MMDGSTASANATFSSGLLSRADWQNASWLAGAIDVTLPPARNNFRYEFNVASTSAKEGSAYIAAAGYHEFFCNGRRMGDPGVKLSPGNVNFLKRVYYIKYDITGCLRAGKNTFGVSLGNAWFSAGAKNPKTGTGMPGARPVPPQFMLRAQVRYPETGRPPDTIVSGPSSGAWLAAPGAITRDSLYNGETYDDRLALEYRGVHFSDPSYAPAAVPPLWRPAVPAAASAVGPHAILKVLAPLSRVTRSSHSVESLSRVTQSSTLSALFPIDR